MARQISDQPQSRPHHHGGQNRQPVQAIGQVDGVAHANDDEVGHHHVTHSQGNGDRLEKGHDQVRLGWQFRAQVEEQGRRQPEQRLPSVLGPGRQAVGALALNLEVVVHPANAAKGQGDQQHRPYIAVAKLAPHQGGEENDDQDQRAAHGRGAGLAEMAFRTVAAHRLANLVAVEAVDHPGAYEQRQRQRRHHADHGAEGQVLKDSEAADELGQIIGKPKQHQAPPSGKPMAWRTASRSLNGCRRPSIS